MKIRALCGAVVAGALIFTAIGVEAGKLERCYRRCEKQHGILPTPEPTRSPTPPTHTMGKSCDYELRSSRTITFVAGDPEPVLICHTQPHGEVPPGGASPFIEVSTQNHGNATCADYWLQMYSPNGAVSEPSEGSQPSAIMQRVGGRYVIAVLLREANNAACSTLTFTVR